MSVARHVHITQGIPLMKKLKRLPLYESDRMSNTDVLPQENLYHRGVGEGCYYIKLRHLVSVFCSLAR